MVTVKQIIKRIETRQVVVNKDNLDQFQLNKDIKKIASLDQADQDSLSFLAKQAFISLLNDTQAGVAIVTKNDLEYVPSNCIALVVSSPYLAYASCSQLFDGSYLAQVQQVHPTVVIDKTAVIGHNVSIDAYTVIDSGVHISDNTHIGSNVRIHSDCYIGKDSVIKSNVTIADNTYIGEGVRIHAGASIGAEGFGFAPTNNPATTGWERIAQLGCVRIGNYVRVGANTTIDRGAINDTIIDDHVIIDNLVQIAHNVKIGSGTAIAAKTGIAGSVVIGKNCIIGGAVGIAGHLEIADNVTITGMSMVSKSIATSGSYSSGIPAIPSQIWRRAVVRLRQLGKNRN